MTRGKKREEKASGNGKGKEKVVDVFPGKIGEKRKRDEVGAGSGAMPTSWSLSSLFGD
jgi:hypothetical protein